MSIGWFIDAAYVYREVVRPQGRIDYLKLRNYLERDLADQIDEGYFFNATDDQASPQLERLHNALGYQPPNGPGLRVKCYWLQKRELRWPDGSAVVHPRTGEPYQAKVQKAVDVGLVYHMIRSFTKRRWTKLVLVAGDADFHEPVQHLVESENVDLYLVGTLSTISDTLRPWARKLYELDKEPLLSAVLYGPR